MVGIAPSRARLIRLISHGYFPSELPPPFTTADFSNHAVALAATWQPSKIRKFWTRPEGYNIPRYGHARRNLSIVNPVNQLYVSDLIADNWLAIRRRLKRSKITEFDPKIIVKGRGRAVTGVNFDGVARRRAELLGSYGRYIKTDIARFYPSIYTHSLAWAMIGKALAKTSHHQPAFKQSFANLIDKAVAAGQEGQTVGIPIGPDTSRILSELVAVEIETIVRSHVPDLDNRSVRYVDDMLIGLTEDETPSEIIAKLSSALYEYELELSADKTEVHGIGCPHAPEWVNYIRTFELSSRRGQRDDLDSYFEQALHLSDANPRENVLLFAAKRAATFDVTQQNHDHLVRWLLYTARRGPVSLGFVAEHLASLIGKRPLPDVEIHEFIYQQIPLKAACIHTHELAWLLFWARELQLKLPAALFRNVVQLRSSAAALLTLDLRQRGLVIGSLKLPFWKSHVSAKGLQSEMWLAAYEATKKGWWTGRPVSGPISGHEFFGDLWSRNVEFYDPTKRARKRAVRPSVFARLTAWADYDQAFEADDAET